MSEREQTGKQAYHHGDLRRALLAAAEAELIEKGPDGFTLRGCAKRAGVSHAAPAHHFGDATGLLSALASEGFERFLSAMKARAEAVAQDDADARLIAAGLGYIDFARANPALFRLMFSSGKPDGSNAALCTAAGSAFGYLAQAAAHLAGPEPLSSLKGRRQLAALWAMAHGLADLLLSGRITFLGGPDGAEEEDDIAAILSAAAMR